MPIPISFNMNIPNMHFLSISFASITFLLSLPSQQQPFLYELEFSLLHSYPRPHLSIAVDEVLLGLARLGIMDFLLPCLQPEKKNMSMVHEYICMHVVFNHLFLKSLYELLGYTFFNPNNMLMGHK